MSLTLHTSINKTKKYKNQVSQLNKTKQNYKITFSYVWYNLSYFLVKFFFCKQAFTIRCIWSFASIYRWESRSTRCCLKLTNTCTNLWICRNTWKSHSFNPVVLFFLPWCLSLLHSAVWEYYSASARVSWTFTPRHYLAFFTFCFWIKSPSGKKKYRLLEFTKTFLQSNLSVTSAGAP